MRISDWISDVCSSDLFSKALFPDNQASLIILDGASENFRGGSAEAIDQHSQRAAIDLFRVLVPVCFNALAGVFYLYYRPFLDDETGEFNGFQPGSAAVVAQVTDQSLHAALFLTLK